MGMLFKLLLNILLYQSANNNNEQTDDNLSNSLKKLNWDKKSVSFDDTEITSTRPGFGKIITIQPNDIVKHVINKLGNNLVAKTKYDKLHVTVFCVILNFQENYDPSALPSNLLSEFQKYIDESLKDSLTDLESNIENEIDIKVTNQPKVFGAKFPSHLVLEVKLKEHEKLTALKNKANRLGCEWIKAFTDLLKNEKNHKVENGYPNGESDKQLPNLVKSLTGGFSVFISYTAEQSYTTHTTIGLFAESDDYNKMIRRAYSPEVTSRIIDPDFSESAGNSDLKKEADELSRVESDITLEYIKRMTETGELRKKYPNMNSLFSENQKKTPSLVTFKERKELTQFVTELKLKDEKYKLREILDTLEGDSVDEKEVKEFKAKVLRIEGGIINMDRIQNFAP